MTSFVGTNSSISLSLSLFVLDPSPKLTFLPFHLFLVESQLLPPPSGSLILFTCYLIFCRLVTVHVTTTMNVSLNLKLVLLVFFMP